MRGLVRRAPHLHHRKAMTLQEKIQALRAKAASTTFPGEAASFTAKADEFSAQLAKEPKPLHDRPLGVWGTMLRDFYTLKVERGCAVCGSHGDPTLNPAHQDGLGYYQTNPKTGNMNKFDIKSRKAQNRLARTKATREYLAAFSVLCSDCRKDCVSIEQLPVSA